MFITKIKSVIPAILVSALFLPLAACDNPNAAGEKTVRQAEPEPVKENAAQQLGNKLNYYVKCFNTVDGEARNSAQRYLSWIADKEKGPTGKERNVNVLGEITAYELKTCTDAITTAAKEKPALPAMDDAASRYLADLTTLVPLISQAHHYYSQEDYKDDGFAKAKEMHQPLTAAFKKFIAVSDVYGAEIEQQTNTLYAAQLVEIEKNEGRHTAYYRLALVTQGKALATQFDAESPDIGKITQAVDAYGALVSEATKNTADEQGKPISWSVFLSKAETFLKDSKDLMRRLRDKTPYSHGDKMLMKGDGSSGWMVAGSPMRVFKSYNELVETSNRL